MAAFFKKTSSANRNTQDKPAGGDASGKSQEKKADSRSMQEEAPAVVASQSAKKTDAISGDVLRVKFPWITEKITRISKDGQYAFVVADECNKNEAKKLIEKIYNVHVTAVHVINVVGKRRRLGGRIGKREGFKKVIVSLRRGETIDVVPH